MIGIVDVGGGMKAIYSAGLLDYCLDNGIYFDYALGVSAGSGNLINYTARQKERLLRFYTDYSFRKEYMSLGNFIKNGEYCHLDYPYSILSHEDGEDPIDYEALIASSTVFNAVVTNLETGLPEYYGEETLAKNEYWLCKASSSIPIVSKPIEKFGNKYYDGGISDPIPLKRALEDGCDKVVVVLSRPIDYRKSVRRFDKIASKSIRKYPETAKAMLNRAELYNQQLEAILKDESLKDKVLIMAPSDTMGIDTLSKKKDEIKAVYELGYADGPILEKFYNGL